MMDKQELTKALTDALDSVIDPETGLSVMRMGLVRNLEADPGTGAVSLTFRPTSPVCPLAFKLGDSIQKAVRSVPQIGAIELRVENHAQSQHIEDVLAQARQSHGNKS